MAKQPVGAREADLFAGAQPHNPLPARYYQLMEQGIARAEQRLAAEPSATLASLEAQPGWTHFPSAILAAAVLYTKGHPANSHRGDAKMLQLALKIGDLLANEQEADTYGTRLDHHRDTYMWLEAYRLLEQDLGKERRERWRRAITVDIDEMGAKGYLAPGNTFVVHDYKDALPAKFPVGDGHKPFEVHFYPGPKKLVVFGQQ